MAGYMSGHTHYRYDGLYANGTGAPLYNGMLVALTAVTGTDGSKTWQFTLPAANKGVFNVVRQRNVFEDTPGLEVEVVDDGDLYLVENLILTNDSNESWNGAEWAVADGQLIRAHKLHTAEYFVTDQLAAALNTYEVGDTLKSAATGRLTA